MQWGATVSHRYLDQLGLDLKTSFVEILGWKLDLLRLCVYWDESNPSPDQLELGQLLQMLDFCEAQGQHVIVTIGMKAPRWPEFYFPTWVTPHPQDKQTQHQLLYFLEKLISQLQHFSCISGWQVENEPLDPSCPANFTVPLEFLEAECSLIQNSDQRPLLLTAWGNELRQRKLLPILETLAPRVGIDLYEHQYQDTFLIGPRYVGPKDGIAGLKEYLSQQAAEVWVTELQAEPWEKDEAGYRSAAPLSMNAQILQQHIQHAAQLPVDMMLFWGVEYWLWKAQQGERSLIEVATSAQQFQS